MSTVLLDNIGQLVTNTQPAAAGVRANARVLIRDGNIVSIDGGQVQADHAFDCGGGVVTPGFVDSHTHAVFGSWRFAEYELRSLGTPYMEIARQGGGMDASVRDVRSRSEDELVALSRPRLLQMMALGTTTAEVKSGYGLTTADELKLLRAIRRSASGVPIDVVPTFLGAHEFPPEYRDDRDAYVELIAEEMIPAVAADRLARFCDVFMEPGVFTAAQTRRVLQAGLRHGLLPKLHADEFENAGAAEVAAELGAISADHLGAISERGIAALAASGTTATLLPATLFFLGKRQYAPARRLIEAGATVALASDFNPGTAPSPSMPLVMTMACSQMGMTPLEAIHAATAGGARALALEDGTGTLKPGAPADLVLWNAADYRELPYHFGVPPIQAVWKRGILVSGACDALTNPVFSTP